jgi:hypothetical protein
LAQLTAKLTNGYYYKLELPEGDYVLTHMRTIAGGDPQKIHVTAGQTLYFRNEVTSISYVFEVAGGPKRGTRTSQPLETTNQSKIELRNQGSKQALVEPGRVRLDSRAGADAIAAVETVIATNQALLPNLDSGGSRN